MWVIRACTTVCQLIRSSDPNTWLTATYSTFSISDEVGKYQLSVGGYSGDAGLGDALAAAPSVDYVANGMKFSTPDNDNDNYPNINCASQRGSGWWFNKCTYGCLNFDANANWNTAADMDVIHSLMWLRAPGNVMFLSICLFVCHSVKAQEAISSFFIIHNVVDRDVLQAMWEELAGKVGHRDQLIIC